METIIKTKQYGDEIILPNLTSEAGAKTYGPPVLLLDLHNSVCFILFLLRWVLDRLTNDLREKWMEYAQAILPFLHAS
jgi:hypothetical protein